MSKDRRLTLMRWALTRATSKWNVGGRVKSQGKPKPVSLGGKMSKTFTRIWVVMRDGAPVGAYTDREEAMAHSRAIGGPGKGHAIGITSLELVHGRREDADQQDRAVERADREDQRR